ncbi:MAG: type II toxin-antitoxin system VapC family toxin [Candidatus Aminicenantes bacterium]|nr:MAG: type II toxin-antitoxin system VapC family toxin [Candidatus Aminicenantes bacterium]
MIVVDSNIIIYVHVQSERTDLALCALRKDPYWVAPLLWQSEFRNVMAGYIRRRILKLEDAKQVMKSALRTMEDREILPPSELVLDLVAASDCSAYDCEYVALARHLDVKLVTSDQKILQNFPEIAIELGAYTSSS